MAVVNREQKLAIAKILYVGPPRAGKTTCLRTIVKETSTDFKFGRCEFVPDSHPKELFEFVPLSMGYVGPYQLRLHLYTLPNAEIDEDAHRSILRGLDGCIFTADSRLERVLANTEALADFRDRLLAEGYRLDEIPKIFQYNQRDLQDILPLEALRDSMNPLGDPEFSTIGWDPTTVMPPLVAMGKKVLGQMTRLHWR